MRRFIPLTLALLLFLLVPSSGIGEAVIHTDVPTCRSLVSRELAKEQRRYRSILFGHPHAKDAPVGEVRFAQDGNPWIKAAESTWRTVAQGYEETDWSDTLMDNQDELTDLIPRKGIFETKGAATSDLVPYLAQAYRSLKCRTTLLCRTVELSLDQEASDPQSITVTVPGCIQMDVQTFRDCHFVAAGLTPTDKGSLITYCRLVKEDLTNRERDLLKLATEYDASYRSLLELSGEMDAFLMEFRWPMANSLRKAAELVGSLQRIPCFLASCDEGPPHSSSSSEGP